jgi:hypothetical protein
MANIIHEYSKARHERAFVCRREKTATTTKGAAHCLIGYRIRFSAADHESRSRYTQDGLGIPDRERSIIGSARLRALFVS